MANEKDSWLNRIAPALVLAAICWITFGLNTYVWHGHLNNHGIVPRQTGGLWGVLWAPFLHASLNHLLANTVPLLGLGIILCIRSRGEFFFVTIGGILLGGGMTWAGARTACHIGASGLIFAWFGYIASLAIFTRTVGTLCLSLVCVVLYGGMIRGLIPTFTAVSWESHAAGFIAGIVLAWLGSKFRKTPAQGRA